MPRVAELLLEIGFEEMPSPWLPGLAEQLQERFREAAQREFLSARESAVAYTPRRLVLRAELPERQPDREEPSFGPALRAAKDAAGNWTAAAQGFARKHGVSPEALREGVKDPAKPDERHLLFVRSVAGRPSAEVLPPLLAGVLRALAFPKRMSWDAWLDDGRGAFPFGRPIRWLVLLLDSQVVPFAIRAQTAGVAGGALVESGRLSHGHRFLPQGRGGEPFAVRSFQELREGLRERFVLLDPAERRARIDAGLASAGGSFEDHGLRDEWRDLVEFPTVLCGEVPAEFRSLPAEVLETVLVHHQKYISLREAGGRIARFAAVVNGDGSSAPEILRGMERVVVARLRDAAFFLAEDRKRPLAERLEDLAGVSFHHGLGSYRDKAARLERLVAAMSRLGLLSESQCQAAGQAARLAKTDLVTLMVREFPELQGVVGGLYLAAEAAPAEVAEAVRWHYHPIAVEPDAEPAAAFAGRNGAARVFAAVALADKLDTLAGYFGIGENPTGSRDPFGLRRAGQGALRAVLDFWRPQAGERAPDLEALVKEAVGGFFPGKPTAERDRISNVVSIFLLERLGYVLRSRGFSADEVSAVVDESAEAASALSGPQAIRALADPIDALHRVEALQRVRREVKDDFAALAEAFKRAKNILTKAAPAARVDPRLFEDDAERSLFDATARLESVTGSYEDRLRALAALREPVGRFFDDVLVMAGEPKQGNRLAILERTLSLFYRISDISKLGGTS